jgi:hypothetical protein
MVRSKVSKVIKVSKKIVFLLGLLIASINLQAQVNRYMVHFTDKDGSPYSIENPGEFLSQRALDRRSKQDIAISLQDLPVNQDYVIGVEGIGAHTFFSSKWFNAVLVQCDPSLIEQIESLPYVEDVEYVAPGEKVNPDARRKRQKTRRIAVSKTLEEASEAQNSFIGVDMLHENGITGEGMLIAVMDAGFIGANNIEAFQHLYDNNKIQYEYDFVYGQEDVYQHSTHGTKVFSLLGAYEPGTFLGSAYNANYLLFVTEDDCNTCEHRVEEYNFAFAAELADSAGVDVINISLGYNLSEDPSMDYEQEDMDGETAVITRAADIAASRGIVVVASAGNEGNVDWGIITAPGDAKNVLTVGNVRLDGTRSSSSSMGPTADNRIKPDVSALGSGVRVLSSTGSVISGSGTSFSAPQVAGLVALTWQAYPELNAEELRFLLLQTSSNSGLPNNEIGYGIPNFKAFQNFIDFSDSEEQFLIYPNPVENDKLLIRVNNPSEVPLINLQVFNANGQKVMDEDMEFSWNDNTQIIDLYTFSSGVYIFNLNTGSKVDQLKIVKI